MTRNRAISVQLLHSQYQFNENNFKQTNRFRWIVTAAHCIHGGDITAFIGIDANGDFYDNYTIASQRQFIHPEYSDETDANDIGKLDNIRMPPNGRKLPFNSHFSHLSTNLSITSAFSTNSIQSIRSAGEITHSMRLLHGQGERDHYWQWYEIVRWST